MLSRLEKPLQPSSQFPFYGCHARLYRWPSSYIGRIGRFADDKTQNLRHACSSAVSFLLSELWRRHVMRIIALAVLLVAWAIPSSSGYAEAPAEQFLQKLREAGLYDMALLYLDRTQQDKDGSDALREVVELERGQTLLDQAGATRVADELNELLASAEEALRRFLEAHPDHDRAAEARLQLATLQLVRGQQLVAGDEPTAEDRAAARTAFQGAVATFDTITENLREKLKSMQGEKIDAEENPELIRLRDRLRVQFLRALLEGGRALQRVAETYPEGDSGRKQPLSKAVERFTELTEKYSRYVIANKAMLYRGQAQEELGDNAAALDSYQRMLEQPEIDSLREAKTEAMTGAIRTWLAQDPPQHKTAIQQGRAWLDTMRPTERSEAVWQDLRIELARAYLRSANAEGATAQDRKGKDDARKLLTAAMRTSGAHQEEARRLLGELGIEPITGDESEPTVDVANVKSFDEGFAAARSELEEAEAQGVGLKILQDKATSGAGDAEELKAQEQLVAEVEQHRAAAVALLQRALALATDQTPTEEINRARYYIAYLELKREHFHEAAAVGEFVARRFPSSQLALQSGLLAMMSFQELAQGDDSGQAHSLGRLESLAGYLSEQWPNDPQAAGASGLLVRIALTQRRWEDAAKHIEALPADSAERRSLQRLLGQLQWNAYLEAVKAEQTAEANQRLEASIANLQAGLEGVAEEQVDPQIVQAALVLAKAQLKADRPEDVLATLQHESYGPLMRLEKDDPPSAGDLSAADVYRVALQAQVARLVEGGGSAESLDRARQLIEQLQASLSGSTEGSASLVRIFYELASDIRTQLDNATVERRRQLIGAFRLLLDELARTADDPATLHWVAQTFLQMGQSEAGETPPPVQGLAKDLLGSSIAVYDRLLGGKVGGVPEQSQMQMRLELARAQRLTGDFRAAIDNLEKLLLKKPAMLDAQVEAALAYQQWGRSGSENLYKAAMLGGRRNDKTGQNTIWGWGKLGTQTNGREEFQDIFFESRYRLAESRFLFGQRQQQADEKTKYTKMAEKDIVGTVSFYPDLGGPEMHDRFDALLRRIQHALGEPATGLPERDG